MGKQKMVTIESLQVLTYLLDDLANDLKGTQHEGKALRIMQHMKDNVMEEDKMYINELKRSIYTQMKNAATPEESQNLYKMYQSLKLFNNDEKPTEKNENIEKKRTSLNDKRAEIEKDGNSKYTRKGGKIQAVR